MKYYQKCVKFACNYFKNSSASGGLRPPDPLQGLHPWTPPGDSRPPDPLWFFTPSQTSFRRLCRRITRSFRASRLQASALEELRRLVAFMNHSVAAAAAVAPTPISTATVFDGPPLVKSSTSAWCGRGQQQDPAAESGHSTQMTGTSSYDEEDDEELQLSS